MIDGMARKNSSVVRGLLSQVQRSQELVSDEVLDDVVEWFDRISCHDKIRRKMKARFGYGVMKGADGYETYSRAATQKEIDMGFYEAVDVGIGQRIVSALANLFTRKDQNWQFYSSTGETDETTADVIESHRTMGGAYHAQVSADRLACATESGAIRVLWEGGSLRYEAIAPQHIKVLYGPTVIDDGVARPANITSLDDASAVVVRLSGSVQSVAGHYSDCRWIAYVGRSETYPDGRCVTYVSPADAWDRIPAPGTPGTYDVVRSGTEDLCNPLSWLANREEGVLTEYPIVLLRGGHITVSDSVIPTQDTLYDSVVELTLGWSRTLKDALSGALGREVLSNPQGQSIPETTEGVVVLRPGQTYEIKNMSAGSITAAVDTLYAASGAVANGWSVPSYTVVSRIGSAPDSGVALAIQAAPLMEFSIYREKINARAIVCMFGVERCLINYHLDSAIIPWDAYVTWTAGTLDVPRPEAERVLAITAALDAGLTDSVGAIREYHGLATDAEAQSMYDALRERSAASPRIGASAPKPAGLGLPPRAPRIG
jgi:hypothetical protein